MLADAEKWFLNLALAPALFFARNQIFKNEIRSEKTPPLCIDSSKWGSPARI
jgi:hypothetical protein